MKTLVLWLEVAAPAVVRPERRRLASRTMKEME